MYTYPLPPRPPTPPQPSLLGHHRAWSGLSCAIQPFPTSYLFSIRECRECICQFYSHEYLFSTCEYLYLYFYIIYNIYIYKYLYYIYLYYLCQYYLCIYIIYVSSILVSIYFRHVSIYVSSILPICLTLPFLPCVHMSIEQHIFKQ